MQKALPAVLCPRHRAAAMSRGWTPRSIAQIALPSMADQFYPLANHMSFFGGDAE